MTTKNETPKEVKLVTSYSRIFGLLMAQYREEGTRSQENMAKCLGLPPEEYARLEAGEQPFHIDQFRLVAKTLGRQPKGIIRAAETMSTILQEKHEITVMELHGDVGIVVTKGQGRSVDKGELTRMIEEIYSSEIRRRRA